MDSYKGGGAGEMRRINVVYFLSRGGRSEHPHLFRVNQLHRAGVRLRDVKRWLSEVRGKDMPENFSWSYKRKYKAGYVWQDLMDDDLITPVSDNEYVLKGCDVRGTPPCPDTPKASSLDEKERKDQKVVPDQKLQVEKALVIQVAPNSGESSPKPPTTSTDEDTPGGERESARRATPDRIVLPLNLQAQKQQQDQAAESAAATKQLVVVARAAPAVGADSKKHPVRRMRVARVLNSILTCGTADADDAALRPVLRQRTGADDGDWSRTPVCPGIDGCGINMSRKARPRRGGGGVKDKQHKGHGGKRDGGAHKPAILPRCSQCGKEFKPQEMHSHMQSCRGLRERMRSTAGARASAERKRGSAARPDRGSGDKDAAAGCSPSKARPPTAFLLTES